MLTGEVYEEVIKADNDSVASIITDLQLEKREERGEKKKKLKSCSSEEIQSQLVVSSKMEGKGTLLQSNSIL